MKVQGRIYQNTTQMKRGIKKMKYQYIVGMDVAKDSVQASRFDGTTFSDFSFPNQEKSFLKEIQKSIPKSDPSQILFVMEATGVYHLKLATALYKKGYPVAVINPFIIKKYAEMLLKKAKTDKNDARLIAQFGFYQEVTLFVPKEGVAEEITQVLKGLDQLNKARTNLKNYHEALTHRSKINPVVRDIYQKQLEEVEKAIKTLEAEAKRLVSQYAPKEYQLLLSIKGIGKYSATALLGFLQKMDHFSRGKEVASFLGLAPQISQSGKDKGKAWLSKKGNGYLRRLLYLAALSASRSNAQCRELYQRLLAKGKPKKVALIAVANKLLRQAFAVLKSGCPYDPQYLNQKSNLEVVLT